MTATDSEFSPEMRQLYEKAMATPNAITPAEKNLILERPSPDKEDRLCRAKTQLSWAELVKKGVARPDELSPTEVDIMVLGVVYGGADKDLTTFATFRDVKDRFKGMPEDHKRLYLGAHAAVTDENECRVFISANQIKRTKRRRGKWIWDVHQQLMQQDQQQGQELTLE
jgi:hypothetical protein